MFPGTDGIRGAPRFWRCGPYGKLTTMTGGDEHGTQVERVPQRSICVCGALAGRVAGVCEKCRFRARWLRRKMRRSFGAG